MKYTKEIIKSQLIYAKNICNRIPTRDWWREINGIFHYEPIFGDSKLQKIQENDSNKFQKCQEHGITLYSIDTSSQKYFKESTSQKFLNIVTNIIDNSF